MKVFCYAKDCVAVPLTSSGEDKDGINVKHCMIIRGETENPPKRQVGSLLRKPPKGKELIEFSKHLDLLS